MRIFILSFCILFAGCTTFDMAKEDLKRDVNGFKSEFARVFLKKEIDTESTNQ